jgi:cytochrome c-type biogenesis protein CcmH/NrfG
MAVVAPVAGKTNQPFTSANIVSASRTNADAQASSDMDVAFMALEQSKPNVALGIFTKVLQKDPTNRRARFGLSTALIQAEKYKEAMAILEAMIKEVPQDYVTKNNLAWVYATATDLKVRDGKRAVELAQEALMICPTDCHVWSTLSEAYFICGRYDKALRNAEHALRVGRDTNADAKLLTEYQNQVDRCRKAAESMAILE